MKNFLSLCWKYWMKFAHIVGEVNQFILLGIVYFIVIGFYAIFTWPFKWFKKPLKTNWKTSAEPETLDQLTRPF